MKFKIYFTVLFLIFLSACNNVDKNNVLPEPNIVMASSSANVSNKQDALTFNYIEDIIKIGSNTDYMMLREKLLAEGWKPYVQKSCHKEIFEQGISRQCNAFRKDYSNSNDELIRDFIGECAVCNDLPELDKCASNGFCYVEFTKGNDIKMYISVYGEIDKWKDGELFVTELAINRKLDVTQ